MKKKKKAEQKVIKIERKPELMSATFSCPRLEKELVVPFSDLIFDGKESECDLCGSHGDFTIGFQCDCGDFHHVEVKSW